jgi:malonyl-CoA O-methyltransferase
MDAQKQAIANAFSRSACRYDQAATVQQQAGEQLLQKMKQRLTDNFRDGVIADIGCGTGYFSQAIVDQYQPAQYIGIDIAEGMLTLAAKNNHHLTNARWLCHDAENLPMEEQSVDMIYANFSLQWCEDLNQLMQSFYRVLKPGGVCCFTSLGAKTLGELRDSWAQVDQFDHVNQFYDADIWEVAIERNQFTVVEQYQTTATVYFDSVAAALRSLKDIGANVVKGEHPQGLTGKQRFRHFTAAYETYRHLQGIPVTYEIDGWIIKK